MNDDYEVIVLTQADVNPQVFARGKSQLWFPDLPIGTGMAPSGHVVNADIAEEWVRRALFLFKHTPTDRIQCGTTKRIVMDEDDFAFSLEYYPEKSFADHVLRRKMIMNRVGNLKHVVAPLAVYTMAMPGEGGFLIQKMLRCDGGDLFFHTGNIVRNRDVETLVRDLVMRIAPLVQKLHARGLYLQDIKLENILLRKGHLMLSDLEGCVMMDSDDDLSRRGYFHFSPFSAIYTPFHAPVTLSKLHHNDVAAICMVILMVASRYGYAIDDANRGCELAGFIRRNIFDSPRASPFSGERLIPTGRYDERMWMRMTHFHPYWDGAAYAGSFSKRNLQPFSATVGFCLRALSRIGQQRFHRGDADPLSDFQYGLLEAYFRDVNSSAAAGKRSKRRKEGEKKVSTPRARGCKRVRSFIPSA